MALGSLQAQNVIFSEDFESGMPSSFILHNEDGLTPAAGVSIFTDAWIVLAANTSNAAGSTSWYSPPGQADDWMVIPGISITSPSTILKWKSYTADPSFPDGYEVRISTTGTNPADFTAAPVFSVAADQTSWGEHIVDLSTYAGNTINIAFRNNSTDMYILFVDDIEVLEFTGTDAAVTGLNVSRFHQVGSNVTISGQIMNLGATAITGFDLHWTDGTNTNTQNITGLNLASAETYNFSHSTQLSVADPNDYNIEVSVELAGDQDNSNDMSAALVTGYSNNPDRVIVGEEATGTWCGWCPRGHVWMEYMEETYEDSWIGIAVHNSDPMTITEYDNWMGELVGGYPSGIVSRSGEFDPSEFVDAYDLYIDGFALATVDVEPVMDNNRDVTVNVTSMFASNTVGSDFRYALVVVEDGVTGTTSDWAQTNYYSSQSQNIPLDGAGHNWQAEPNPVPASEMVYNDVARELLNGVLGAAGSVPATVNTTDEVNYSLNFTLDQDYDEANVRIVALLLDNVTGEIYNAGEEYVYREVTVGDRTVYVQRNDTFELFGDQYVPLSVKEQSSQVAFTAYPNPANDVLTLSASALADNARVRIFDMTGKLVYEAALPALQTLNGAGTAQINVSGLSNGMYNVVLTSDESTMSQTVSIVH